MKIKFCGAAQEITGSAHLITLDDGYTILLDCGLYQGRAEEMKNFNENWLFDPSKLDCVILSHAHIDHTGRLPKLVKDGFKGPIYCTHATRSLCAIMLLDSAKIQERDAAYDKKKLKEKQNREEYREALYGRTDVKSTLNQFTGCSYNRWFEIDHSKVQCFFTDAGHILGSASITLKIQEGNKEIMFGFSGDIGRPARPILRDPVPMPTVDYLICESTYGDRVHTAAPSEKTRFLEIIKRTCIERKGKLLIPAFSIGRTQELVYLLDQLETEGLLPKVPVYVDSPLAVNATTIFGTHPECFDNELNEYLLIDDNPFGFNSLSYIKKRERSKELNTSDEPCIIISSSGMMNAGRVKHHLFHCIEEDRNAILIVGYCSPNTPGGMLRNGVDKIKLFGRWKSVNAKVEVMDSFSAHADKLEMLDFLKGQRESVRKLFLVHGTYEKQMKFKQLLNTYGFEDIQIPDLGDEFILD